MSTRRYHEPSKITSCPERYRAVMDAYLSGLVEAAQGRPFESCIADAEGAA